MKFGNVMLMHVAQKQSIKMRSGGRATSGGYGWRCGKSLVLGLVRLELAAIGTELEIEILGEKYKAIVIKESPFDPTNECLRS
jgi:Glycine cleavage system T protein (aminomethyltransferase)